ncbi:MAG: hypothetical protein ACE5E5_14865 [Phycisphaerae bacterium]
MTEWLRDRFSLPFPSFLRGMARLADVSGSLNEPYRRIILPEYDALAIYSDWSAVGDDLAAAMDQVIVEAQEEEEQQQATLPF